MFSKIFELNKIYNLNKPSNKITNVLSIIKFKLIKRYSRKKARKILELYMKDNIIQYELLLDYCNTFFGIEELINQNIPDINIKIVKGIKYVYILNVDILDEETSLEIQLNNENKNIDIIMELQNTRYNTSYKNVIAGDSIKDLKIIKRVKEILYKSAIFLIYTEVSVLQYREE